MARADPPSTALSTVPSTLSTAPSALSAPAFTAVANQWGIGLTWTEPTDPTYTALDIWGRDAENASAATKNWYVGHFPRGRTTFTDTSVKPGQSGYYRAVFAGINVTLRANATRPGPIPATTPVTLPATAPAADVLLVSEGTLPLRYYDPAHPPMAPASIHVDGSAISGINILDPADPHTTKDRPDLAYDFGDVGSSHNADLVGWASGHVYDSPGTYAIRCVRTDPPSTGSGQANGSRHLFTNSVTVLPDTRTRFYASDSGGDDASDGSYAHPWKTAGHAVRSAPANSQITLLATDTFPFSGTLSIAAPNVRICSYGVGPKPILLDTAPHVGNTNAIQFQKLATNGILENVVINSTVGVITTEQGMPNGICPVASNVLIRDVEIYGVAYAVQGNQAPAGLTVWGCKTYHDAAYSIWIGGCDDLLVCGCDFRGSHDEHVLRGGGNRVSVCFTTLDNSQYSQAIPAGTIVFPATLPTTLPTVTYGGGKASLAIQGGAGITIYRCAINPDGLSGPGNPLGFGPLPRPDNLGTWVSWATVEACDLHNVPCLIVAGTRHVSFVANEFQSDNRSAFGVGITTTVSGVTKSVIDLRIAGNTVHNVGAAGSFIDVPLCDGPVVLESNRYDAPNLAPVKQHWEPRAAVVNCYQNPTSRPSIVTRFNQWPVTKSPPFAFYFGVAPEDATKSISLAAWLAACGGSGDVATDGPPIPMPAPAAVYRTHGGLPTAATMPAGCN